MLLDLLRSWARCHDLYTDLSDGHPLMFVLSANRSRWCHDQSEVVGGLVPTDHNTVSDSLPSWKNNQLLSTRRHWTL